MLPTPTARAPRFVSPLLTAGLAFALLVGGSDPARAQADTTLDLADIEDGSQQVFRIYGSQGTGTRGVPVAGGFDMDGDGRQDVAVGYMTADPLGRTDAGEVYVGFGNGVIDGFLDSAAAEPDLLRIFGDRQKENAGSEVWMDDVTGDGLGDLLICRQNYTVGNRCGVGALTILPGSAALRARARSLQPIDLDSPPAGLGLTTIIGRRGGDRLCVWVRTGDVDGDGIADLAIGADQEDGTGETHRGAVYVIRGGSHLAAETAYDLGTFGDSSHPLDGLAARLLPPAGATEFHAGGTCQVADLDGNGRAEVLFAATLNRAGASLTPDTSGGCVPSPVTHSSGGSSRGTLYIAWDDNFPASPTPWPDGLTFAIDASPGSRTLLDGEIFNESFGEEIIGGLDYDGDDLADLFIGDLVADGTAAQNRNNSGLGHMISNAATLKGVVDDMQSPPAELVYSRILGPSSSAISADTAMHGDFDRDGLADLAFSSPHADPLGRIDAGILHVLHGTEGTWPALIDLAGTSFESPLGEPIGHSGVGDPNPPAPAGFPRRTDIVGADGSLDLDIGDTLAYSGAMGDFDGDGFLDIITNEMVGDGFGGTPLNVGNLLLISGRALDATQLFADGFESGTTGRWSEGTAASRSPACAPSADPPGRRRAPRSAGR